MHTVPRQLEKALLSYLKHTYLPEGRTNPKTAGDFTRKDIKFFARGVAEMSAYFTSERAHLPKNYFNKKELRAGYLLYFVITNFLKVKFCLDEMNAKERFKGIVIPAKAGIQLNALDPRIRGDDMPDNRLRILDLGCGPGTASLACADYFRGTHHKIEITAIDQNKGALHDAKHIFAEYVGATLCGRPQRREGTLLRQGSGGQAEPLPYIFKTVYANIRPKSPHPLPLPYGERVRGEGAKFHLIFLANFLSELGPVNEQAMLVDILLNRYLADNGALIIIEPALRWTTRNLMKLRDTITASNNPPLPHGVRPHPANTGENILRSGTPTKGSDPKGGNGGITNDQRPTTINIISPCLHTNPCPMLAANNRDWCHMYLNWERPRVIEEVDRLIGNRKDYIKFSYMIFGKQHNPPSPPFTKGGWGGLWRVVSAPMRSKGKIELLLCNEAGLIRITRLDKNASETNKDLDRVMRGDLVMCNGEFRILSRYQSAR